MALKLLEGTTVDPAAEIVKRLLNPATPDLDDYVQALRTQWRIGRRDVFVENVSRLLKVLTSAADPEVRQLVRLAYVEAVALARDEEAIRFREALGEDPGAVPPSASGHVLSSLSPMGQLAFRAALNDLQAAEEDPNPWRDAGMISLGFFRIIELEMNVRLVHPLPWDDLALALINASSTGMTQRGQKALEFWKRTLKSVRPIGGRASGLELGPLHILLGKLSAPGGPDATLKQTLASSLDARLTDAGRQAFRSGMLARVIDEDVRERYRNPPAHTRYLNLAVAQEARAYVEQALRNLAAWTLPASEPSDPSAP